MTKKCRQFFRGKISERAPTFFAEQGPAESKSGPEWTPSEQVIFLTNMLSVL